MITIVGLNEDKCINRVIQVDTNAGRGTILYEVGELQQRYEDGLGGLNPEEDDIVDPPIEFFLDKLGYEYTVVSDFLISDDEEVLS